MIEYIKTIDGSNTLYSKEYDQNFHSTKDGALSESLTKHVIPSFKLSNLTKDINILDICFGIGYNTFATIYYCKLYNIKTKITFYSPEFDESLVKSLKDFDYPKEFDSIKHIINEVSNNNYYKDDQFEIIVSIGDARKYIKNLSNINIVYQDAFSSEVNKELWSQEYFTDIVKILDEQAIITTYSIATPIRLSMSQNNLNIYQHILPNKRKATIASNYEIRDNLFKYIDMVKKLINNPSAKALRD